MYLNIGDQKAMHDQCCNKIFYVSHKRSKTVVLAFSQTRANNLGNIHISILYRLQKLVMSKILNV